MIERSFDEQPLICLITSGAANPENFPEKSAEILSLVEIAAETKIPLIQIREKQLPARLNFELTAAAAKITRNSKTALIVNDRADIALAAGAGGVQLTQASVPIQSIRRAFGEKFIIGYSAHSLQEAEIAKALGADFVSFSPIYPTPSKAHYGEPQGLEKLQEVCLKLGNFPVVALGGIDEKNYRQALAAGAAGFAAIRFLNDPANLRRLALEFPKS